MAAVGLVTVYIHNSVPGMMYVWSYDTDLAPAKSQISQHLLLPRT